ncbi:MAG: NACHT domain-containing protein, partial [Phycisphaerae bacterium]
MSQAQAADLTPFPERTFKGATALVKNVVLYVGSLAALALGLQKFGEIAAPSASNIFLLAAVALPLAATLVCHTFPVVLQRRRERRLKAGVKGVPKEQGYFRLWPYGDSPADRQAFDRADKAHEQIFDWLHKTSERVLFLTGRSGSGKTSLLHAHVLPRLREQQPPVRIIVLRGYQNPVEALRDELLVPGLIWKERPPADAPDIEKLVAKACAHVRPARLLVVFDQFEELLILHEQDVERREAIERLSQAVEAGRLPGISLLFVLRSDYLGKVQELALPRLRQGDNWHEISPFTEHAARAFLTASGLQPGPRLLDKAMRQARQAEETQGLIRPITVNMIGKILERITSGDDPRLPRERGGLLAGYLRRAVAAPELRDHAPRLLSGMLSEAGTKRPRSVAELAAESQSAEATVRACLLLLGNQGIVRPLDDAANVWEIAHDFVARLLVGVLASWHAKMWKRLRPWIAPLLLL